MPAGPVYQPTTVTYEQQPTNSQRWNCPVSYFSRRITNGFNRVLCLHLGLCVTGIFILITGVAMLIAGLIELSRSEVADFSVIIAGSVLFIVGIVLSIVSGYVIWRRSPSGKEANGNSGASLGILNPSTDPLVSSSAPPAQEDERQNLMDNKECLSSTEESDKMLDKRTCEA